MIVEDPYLMCGYWRGPCTPPRIDLLGAYVKLKLKGVL